MPPRKSHTKAKADDDGVPIPKTKRAPEIQWAKNPDWTFILIEYLGDNVGFCLKLFETEHLTSKQKMEHDERMMSISLKKRKYRFASTPTHGSGSPTPSESAEDKQIQILRLQIRLTELTGGHGMGFPSSYPATTSDRPPPPPPECINMTPTLTPQAGTTWSPAHTMCTLTDYPTTTSDDSSGYTATTSNSRPDTNDGNNTRDYGGIGLGWNMEFNFAGGST
jgi:hypothetical protein